MKSAARRAIVAVTLAASAPTLPRAQTLLPDAPLTTLLKPQPLTRSNPLLPPAPAAPARQPGEPRIGAVPGAVPCAAAASPPRVAYGGSGPGEYGRFLPGADTAPASAKPAPSAAPAAIAKPVPSAAAPAKPAAPAGVDRPLIGVGRPLWNTPAASQPDGDKASDDAAQPGAAQPGLPANAVDRPLWATTPAPAAGATDPAAATRSGEPAAAGCVQPRRG